MSAIVGRFAGKLAYCLEHAAMATVLHSLYRCALVLTCVIFLSAGTFGTGSCTSIAVRCTRRNESNHL